jgi:SAM-dependent methyltransferase
VPLRTLVSDEELQLLEASLRWIEAASVKAFTRLFAERGVVPLPPPQIAVPLIAFDLCEREGAELRGRLRVRSHEGRFYVMEIGLGNAAEYLQDLWPETDALLAALDGLPPGRLLDLGTGCGIIAVEAARRGHQVVATDLYHPTVVLARFNARLNHAQIDLREGHLWDPVAGERFDCILTNPHYGRSDDQLRVEVLCDAADHLTPAGKLLLATALEWENGELGLSCMLKPLSQHRAVKVRPLSAAYKQKWFTAGSGAPSRHRFTIEVGPGAGLDVEMPTDPPRRDFVPLSRLKGRWASVATGPDAAALDLLLTRLISPDAVLPPPLPAGLLDGCRWGARTCVADRGAAGAIVTPDGSVRPCTHAPALATIEQTLAELTQLYQDVADAARAQRGCDGCVAVTECSRCLFPVALDVPHYCDFIRRHHLRLPILHRLLSTVELLDEKNVPPGELRLRRWPRDREDLTGVAAEWNRLAVWVIERGSRHFLAFGDQLIEVDRATADLGAALGDGKPVGARESAAFSALLQR